MCIAHARLEAAKGRVGQVRDRIGGVEDSLEDLAGAREHGPPDLVTVGGGDDLAGSGGARGVRHDAQWR